MISQIVYEKDWYNAIKVSEKEPIVVYCYATWCKPSLDFKTKFIEKTKQYPSVHTFLIDIEQSIDILQIYGILKVPTTLWIMKGKIVDRVYGANMDDLVKYFC